MLTEIATATTGDEELETVVAAVFAGGIACKSINHSCTSRLKLKIYVAQSGAAGATLAIQLPSQPSDGSKEGNKLCPSNPKEECQNCGGADSMGPDGLTGSQILTSPPWSTKAVSAR